MHEEFEAILIKAPLEAEDRELWRAYVKWAPPFLIERFVELFKDDHADLPEMTVNLRQKISAGNDQDLMQVILDQELKSLQAYFKNK